MRQRLLVTRPMPDPTLARAAERYDLTLNQEDERYDQAELLRRAAGHDAILTAPGISLTGPTIAALPESVRIAATFSVGHEHIDLAAARQRGLVVTNTPDVLTDATADITILCLLGATRRAHEGQIMLYEGKWTGWTPVQLMGWHVGGKNLAIFGMGRIGRAVASRARAFGMTVHYHNRNRLSPDLEAGAIYHATPEALLQVAQVLCITAPASASTESFLNAERIALLPDGALVVNSGRGTLVDDDALIAALKSGKVAAAGLDVFRGEPNVDKRYLELPNAFLLPHLGSNTIETRTAMGNCCLDSLDAFFAGREPPNRIA